MIHARHQRDNLPAGGFYQTAGKVQATLALKWAATGVHLAHMRDRVCWPLIGLCAAGIVAAFGQAPAPKKQEKAQTPQEAPVLRVTTRLVQVNVIVQDRKGEPVSDLKKEDFSLLEEGEEQPIAIFSVESTRILPAPREPLPANTFSNRFEQRPSTPTSVTVVLLDELNTRFGDNAYAKDQVIKFLGQIQPDDRVALYLLSGRLRILHDFTNDARPLLNALARHKGGEQAALDASQPEAPDTGNAELDAWLQNANERMGDFYLQNRVRRTINALEAIANHLSRLPGRKNLVWVSGSFPASFGLDRQPSQSNLSPDRGGFTSDIERAAKALSNANMAIYPVDARGLIGPFGTNPNFNAPRAGAGRGPVSNTNPLAQVSLTHDTMNLLADRTGGRAFYNTNDIQGSIRRAINDARVTYVLGFYPAHHQWDGRFREIKVRVKRAGVRVRHRRGYFALADVISTGSQRDAALREALQSPLDATTLGLTVLANPVSALGVKLLSIEVRIDPRDVTLNHQGERWMGELDLLFVQRDAEGRTLKSLTQTLNMRLLRGTYEEAMKEGFQLAKKLDLADGVEEVRVVVRDVSSGSTGSVNIPMARLTQTAGN